MSTNAAYEAGRDSVRSDIRAATMHNQYNLTGAKPFAVAKSGDGVLWVKANGVWYRVNPSVPVTSAQLAEAYADVSLVAEGASR